MIALAGCGAGNDPSSGPSATATSMFFEAARCMRANGYPNWPDPIKYDDSGMWGFPDSAPDVDPPAACAALFMTGKNEQGPKPPADAEYRAQIRKWADCIRANGVPEWPDPDSDGYFDPPAQLRTKDNLAMHNAEPACTALLPPAGFLMKPRTT